MISIVIRVLNEARHLGRLLTMVNQQEAGNREIVVVNSGSTDGSLEIAAAYGARIVHIHRDEFSFGRSLNFGCSAARGDCLVFVSGHCIPRDQHWLNHLTAPLSKGEAAYAYGRQIGGEGTKFSEHQVFAQYFPEDVRLAQEGFFCNNANAALRRNVWAENRFDEDLTGLEDLELGKRLVRQGHRIAYRPDAIVYHLHNETWPQVRRRYEREAIALRKIMPEIHFTGWDLIRCVSVAVAMDAGKALRQRELFQQISSVLAFRCAQYLGSYRGHHIHRTLSKAAKERYFYPDAQRLDAKSELKSHGSQVHRPSPP